MDETKSDDLMGRMRRRFRRRVLFWMVAGAIILGLGTVVGWFVIGPALCSTVKATAESGADPADPAGCLAPVRGQKPGPADRGVPARPAKGAVNHPALPSVRTAGSAPQSALPASSPVPGRWRVTAYCPCRVCCGPKAAGVTASGSRADHPLVAAPRQLPYGTRLTVIGYNADRPVRVEDRGGAIQANRLDVFFATHTQARAWGVRFPAVRFEGEAF